MSALLLKAGMLSVDTQVYALGLIGQLLDIIQRGQHTPKPEPKKVDSGYRQLVG